MRIEVLRANLIEILRTELPLNGMQVCRLINGAKSRLDIRFCHGGKIDPWRDGKNYTKHGNHPYKNCINCDVKSYRVAHTLEQLEREGKIESKKEFRRDPIRPQTKDRMRIWALKGKMPRLSLYFARALL